MTVAASVPRVAVARFDGEALIRALDEQRRGRALTWNLLAAELWAQSSELNERLGGDALCPGALYRTSLRGTMTGHSALPLLRWLGRPPEGFLDGPSVVSAEALPAPGVDRRLRWDLGAVFAALDARRQELGLTRVALGGELGCSPARLTNLRTARLADLGLTMLVTRWLGGPAARFVVAADW